MVVNYATVPSTVMLENSQPRICIALVVITGITAACFCLGWGSRKDGQARISLLICSDMPGQNHVSLAL